jgi:hypothetical protein
MVIVGIHNSTQSKVQPMLFKTPPMGCPLTLSSFIWPPLNKTEYQLSYAINDDSFTDANANGTVASMSPLPLWPHFPQGLRCCIIFIFAATGQEASTVCSSFLDSLCPPFNSFPNTNLFQHLFGVEFHCHGHTYIRAISPFKFISCFGLMDNLWYCLSHPDHWFALDACIPALTFTWLLDHIHDRLCLICNTNSKIFLPRQYAALDAHIQAFVN